MNNINYGSLETAIKDLNLGKTEVKKESTELGQDEFLKLMVAQLKNQDPFEPLENGDFIAQMAQFSSVTGLQQLQKSFEGFASSMQSSQALQASTLVGKNVAIPTGVVNFDGQSDINGFIRLPSFSQQVTLRLFDKETDALVGEVKYGDQSQGDLQFSFNGIDANNNKLPIGNYVLKAEGISGENNVALGTFLYSRVDSVSLGKQSEGVTLNLKGQGSVALSEVEEIR